MTSSIYPLAISPNTPTISATTSILSTDLIISTELVSPGGGGILRLLFSFTTPGPSSVSVINNSSLKGILNADNANVIESNGYYRFDIDVEAGDSINLTSSTDITGINLLRTHLVQFGA